MVGFQHQRGSQKTVQKVGLGPKEKSVKVEKKEVKARCEPAYRAGGMKHNPPPPPLVP